ncbi:growth hormone secretagogue receptor type 1 [Biomphalaria glabrata]|nr:growth hormone secretagogue receptor type 1 [Biomphalaria glabrata]
MTSDNETEIYWLGIEKEIRIFFGEYYRIHAYISTVLSVFGIMGNVLNVFILTRKKMISATNILLTALAVFDGLKSLVHLPFIILNYDIFVKTPHPFSISSYSNFYSTVVIIFHSASIWLTVSLAIFRYIAVRFPLRASTLCSQKRAKLTIFVVCLLITAVRIPNFLNYTFVYPVYTNVSHWDIRDRVEEYNFNQRLTIWFTALFVRLLPCLLLLVLSILLIQELRRASESRSNLSGQGTIQKQMKTNRTTGMLLVVVGLFIVIELPHGILLILVAVNSNFFDSVYFPLGALIDDITLLNNGINFVIYCAMSHKFRDTFMEIFSCCDWKSKCLHNTT